MLAAFGLRRSSAAVAALPAFALLALSQRRSSSGRSDEAIRPRRSRSRTCSARATRRRRRGCSAAAGRRTQISDAWNDKVRDLTESLRQPTGANEELDHRIEIQNDKIDQMQKDFAYRLCTLSAQQLGARTATRLQLRCRRHRRIGQPAAVPPPPHRAPARAAAAEQLAAGRPRQCAGPFARATRAGTPAGSLAPCRAADAALPPAAPATRRSSTRP